MRMKNHEPKETAADSRNAALAAEWLSLRQIARYASISERTLRGWIHLPVDPLPAVRVCGKILVRRSELDTWLGQHRLQPLAAVDIDAIVKDTVHGIHHGR